jgi:outer membrane murein-binding lipoprotein Lpp
MNTTQNTQRIIATAVIAITAGLALASCAQQSVPGEPVQQLTSAQIAELRSGLHDLAESRAQLSRDLAEQRAAARAEQSGGMLDLAESRAQLSRDLSEQRAAAHAEQTRGLLDLAESRAELSRDLAEQRGD